MGKAHLPRPDLVASAHQGRHGCGMVRRAKGAVPDHPASCQFAGDARNHGHFQGFGSGEIGQYARQTGRQQRLARARRPDHHQIVATGRCDFDSALCGFLALDLSKIGAVGSGFGYTGLRRPQQGASLEMIE